jgi:hypothetical protein
MRENRWVPRWEDVGKFSKDSVPTRWNVGLSRSRDVQGKGLISTGRYRTGLFQFRNLTTHSEPLTARDMSRHRHK